MADLSTATLAWRVCASAQAAEVAIQILQQATHAGLGQTRHSTNALLRALHKSPDHLPDMNRAMARLARGGISPDSTTYEIMLMALHNAGQYDEVARMARESESIGVALTSEGLAAAWSAYLKLGLEKAVVAQYKRNPKELAAGGGRGAKLQELVLRAAVATNDSRLAETVLSRHGKDPTRRHARYSMQATQHQPASCVAYTTLL